jgi:hypothetical protein
MQPLTKALRRRLKRVAPELGEREVEAFEHERREAMQAALCEDPLYAAALGAEPETSTALAMARTVAPRPAAEPARVRELGALLQRAAEDERRNLDRKADRALARQGEAARPKRPLPPSTGTKRETGLKKTALKKTAPKPLPLRKVGKKAAGRPPSRTPRRDR